MSDWLSTVENWITNMYREILGVETADDSLKLRFASSNALGRETDKNNAECLVVEDSDIGWLLFILPYTPDLLETQINQILSIRSRLLRESNYTGIQIPADNEDSYSSWNTGLVWLVDEHAWDDWLNQIIDIRRESGVTEEISLDAISISQDNLEGGLDAHGLPRLMLNTRALLKKSRAEVETWRSADTQVSSILENFSNHFVSHRSRNFASDLERELLEFSPQEKYETQPLPRKLYRFAVRDFRNLENLEVARDSTNACSTETFILFGPNGTGKSSFSEALSLAAFGTSPRMEQYISDSDNRQSTENDYFYKYIVPFSTPDVSPAYYWASSESDDSYIEKTFTLDSDGESQYRFDGIILNQEDSIEFTKIPKRDLASRVLRNYSALADHLLHWLESREHDLNERKKVFTQKYGIRNNIKRSETAYERLAQSLLESRLHRISTEFLNWLKFIERLSGDESQTANNLLNKWQFQQNNTISNLSKQLSTIRQNDDSPSTIQQAVIEKLYEYDSLANESNNLIEKIIQNNREFNDQIEIIIVQVDNWGDWLISQSSIESTDSIDSQRLQNDLNTLAK